MEELIMKKRFAALTLVALTFMSCSSLNQLQKQTFDDGLYATSSVVAQNARAEVEAGEIDNLLAESKASPAYIIANGDTVQVAANSVVILNSNNLENITWGSSWYTPWYYSPYYYSWSGPWYYNSRFYNPWYYDYWYGPYSYRWRWDS